MYSDADPALDRPVPLNEHQAKQLLKSYHLPVVEEIVAANATQAAAAARSMGFPVVLKALGAEFQHKTERGLVHLDLQNAKAVMSAAARIRRETGGELEGFLVQPHVRGRREWMAGLFRDPQFGPVVLIGLGGVLAEALDDVSLGIAPLTRVQARRMLDHLRSRRLLDAFRGEVAVDRDTLIDVLMGLSALAMDRPDVREVDINPLLATSDGRLVAVDALVIRQHRPNPEEFPPPVAPEEIGRLFHPRSIAFVGASAQLGKWGFMLPVNTLGGGYAGKIFLVNPRGGTMAGREVYPDLAAIPDPVDLVVVTIPARAVQGLIPQCKACGIRYMLLITSGFGESGQAGRDLEARLVKEAREANLLILGPNTMGIANPHVALFCTGTSVTPRPGTTAIVSQSGNMGTQLLAFAERQGIGIRGFSGSGNEAMITIEDYLEGFEVDELTRTVVLYVESVKNGRRFFDSARRVSRTKPVVLLKGGQTSAGNRAAASHSGALMSDNRVFDAMCRQAGIVKVERPMELLDLAAAFSSLPLPAGPRAAIMTLGGGWGVVTADLCQMHGLEVPALDDSILKACDALLPTYWSHANPIDLVGEQDLDLPFKILERLTAWPGCDAVINLGILGRRIFLARLTNAARKSGAGPSEETLRQVRQNLDRVERRYIRHSVDLMERHGKPIIGVHLMTEGDDQTLFRVPGARFKGVFYSTPERAVYALSKMVQYQAHLSRGG